MSHGQQSNQVATSLQYDPLHLILLCCSRWPTVWPLYGTRGWLLIPNVSFGTEYSTRDSDLFFPLQLSGCFAPEYTLRNNPATMAPIQASCHQMTIYSMHEERASDVALNQDKHSPIYTMSAVTSHTSNFITREMALDTVSAKICDPVSLDAVFGFSLCCSSFSAEAYTPERNVIT